MPAVKTSKEAILQKSLQVFWEQGYYKTSIADLAKACGIEKPHFYYYFKDKKNLMQEVLLLAHQQVKRKVLSLAKQEGIPAAVRLSRMMDTTLSFYYKTRYGCLMGNSVKDMLATDEVFKPLLKSFFEDWVQAFYSLYKESYGEEKAMEMAIQDYQMLQGSMLFMRLYDDILYLENACRSIKSRLP